MLDLEGPNDRSSPKPENIDQLYGVERGLVRIRRKHFAKGLMFGGRNKLEDAGTVSSRPPDPEAHDDADFS